MTKIENTYHFSISKELQNALEKIDLLKSEIDFLVQENKDLWETIKQKLLMNWTYHSNAIEGNTLSQSETFFFLKEGLTVEGKPFKDFLDIKNHSEAIDYIADVIKEKRKLSVYFLKEINALLLKGISSTIALDTFNNKTTKKLHAGEFKKQANHVLQLDGTIHKYVEPEQVAPQMDFLINWVNENSEKIHPVIIATLAHYNMVRIHPFDDGNGRGARILMNIILMQKKYYPVVIKIEDRRKYIEALSKADNGNIEAFILFICNSIITTFEDILKDIKNNG